MRLFPPLRATWALKGTQAVVPITGRNAKRVLFGAIDLKTARRVVLVRQQAGQADAQAFLRALRRRYRGAGWLWLLTDRASAHTAPQTQKLAARLRIRFVWLPRQAPELSPMDQLWRELKRLIAANRQAVSIDALAGDAAAWVLTLTRQQARRKAGMASKHFWLRKLLQNFWRPTQRTLARTCSARAPIAAAVEGPPQIESLFATTRRRSDGMLAARAG